MNFGNVVFAVKNYQKQRAFIIPFAAPESLGRVHIYVAPLLSYPDIVLDPVVGGTKFPYMSTVVNLYFGTIVVVPDAVVNDDPLVIVWWLRLAWWFHDRDIISKSVPAEVACNSSFRKPS